jgi:hypothetical protein
MPTDRGFVTQSLRGSAAGLLSGALAHDGLRELVDGQRLSWDESEAWRITALTRALLDAEVGASDPVRD